MKAFVLISLSDRSERNVVSELKSYPEIRNAYILFGEWDIMAEVDVNSPEQLGTFVLNNIRSRNDVKLTSSMIVAANFSWQKNSLSLGATVMFFRQQRSSNPAKPNEEATVQQGAAEAISPRTY